MTKIFISYRRNDSAIFTGRLFDRLADYYGPESVFLDIESMPSAHDFRETIKDRIRRSGVVLAVIGKQWAGPPGGERRIDNPEDYVRMEIEQAFADRKPTIPVYCDEMEPLPPAELPPSLLPLAYASACMVDSGRDFDHHVHRLRREINKILFPSLARFAIHVTRRFIRRNAAALVACFLLALLVAWLRDPIGRFLLTHTGVHAKVEGSDPVAFSDGEDGVYQIARGLPDRTALVSETDLVKTIRQARRSFDVFALTGSSFFNNPESILSALDHGVKIRIVLLDHSDANRANLETYFRYIGGPKDGVDYSITNSRLAHTSLLRLKQMAAGPRKGSIEMRWWRGSFLNSFWVRDGRSPETALAHAEITYFGDATLNPSVRFGRYSDKMVGSFQDQFESIWERSLPAEGGAE